MEIAGVPTINMGYADQINFYRNTCLNTGCPNPRYLAVPRYGHPEEIMATFYPTKLIGGLMDPLTAKEKEAGLYSPPAPPRILFEGTVDEAQDFLQQTTLVENCRQCPIAKYTDGLPVIIPTEDKVAQMLTGTSHKASETIVRPYATSATGQPGVAVTYAQSYTSNVEKVAICAVMAGCKPQYLPACLAIAVTGGGSTNCPGTSSMSSTWFIVSGPFAKEIGMNAGQESLDIGNPANMTLGRVGALMTVNFGGCIMGLVRTDSGNPLHSLCSAEDVDALPPGWEGLNEESTYYKDGKLTYYTKTQSVIGKIGTQYIITNLMTYPGYHRNLNSGVAGMARKMGVEGVPGHYNFMEFFMTELNNALKSVGGKGFIMHATLAELLYEHGFKKKAEVYKWMWDNYFTTVLEHYNTGLWEFPYEGGRAKESTTGKTWNELLATAPDYKLHTFGGGDYMSNVIIVSDSFADEHYYYLNSGRPSMQSIDYWK